MDRRTRHLGIAAMLLGVALSACGEDPAPDGRATDALSPEDVASALVVASDLGEGWSTTQMPGFEKLTETGLVSEEVRDMLPSVQFCDKAEPEAQEAADDLVWVAFRQLDLDTGAPTEPPAPGEPRQHHLVFVQEFLASGEQDEMVATYDALVSGGDACLGVEKTKDGETVDTTVLAVEALGDASHGWRDVVTEPGPAGRSATWDLRRVLVRDGEVLLEAQVAEITSPGVSTVLDEARIESILQTMVDKLP